MLDKEPKPKIKKSRAGNFIISECEFERLIRNASRQGARLALSELGLDDSCAYLDIKDLRDLLKAFRMAKKQTFKILIKWLVIGIMILITAGFISIISK